MAVGEGDDIHGDDVKLAAPLGGRVGAGGVRVARTLFDHVENKAYLGFQGLGKLAIKNIAEPLRVYRVSIEPRPKHEIVGHEVPRTPFWRRQDEKNITITLRLWLFSLIRRTGSFGTGSLADPENECKPYGEAGMGEPTKAKRTKLKATRSEESESLEAADEGKGIKNKIYEGELAKLRIERVKLALLVRSGRRRTRQGCPRRGGVSDLPTAGEMILFDLNRHRGGRPKGRSGSRRATGPSCRTNIDA